MAGRILDAVLGVPVGARSTTGPVLRRLRTLLAGCAAVGLVLTAWGFAAMHAYAASVHGKAAPAVLELSGAAAALVQADLIAVNSFEAGLADPGTAFQNQLTVASQSLAQVAESNVAGADGSRILLLVQGQLGSYADLVAQAHANYKGGDPVLGTTAMWDASRLLNASDTGTLAELDKLTGLQQAAADRRAGTGWMNSWSTTLWLLPLVGLAVLLVGTQVFLRRRFRRSVNPWLLPATAVLLGLIAYGGVLAGQSRLGDGREAIRQLAAQRQHDRAETQAIERQQLLRLVEAQCPPEGDCGPTVSAVARGGGASPTPGAGAATDSPDLREVTNAARDVDQRTAPPGGRTGVVLIPAMLLVVGALAWAGLYRPLDEYRFRR